MLIFKAATRRVTLPRSVVHNSYLEISRFFRTREIGYKGSYNSTFINGARKRSFVSSATCKNIVPDNRLREVLDKYKITLRPSAKDGVAKFENLTPEQIGQRVILQGYLGSRRDVSKALSFVLLRSEDLQSCVQLVSTGKADGREKQSHIDLKAQREWTPVRIEGTVKNRKPAKDNTVLGMKLNNAVEVDLESIEALNEFPKDIIVTEDTVFPPEQRHLQIRTDQGLLNNLRFRSKVVQEARHVLAELGVTEVETPMLFKSTPEGAREFLVPTRTKGLAYALPQSPQQYKQILMASGIPKYFQFARCFRDEDLRADRQPEFTQLDMEMAFSSDEEVMEQVESILVSLWDRCLGIKDPETNFLRMSYQEAMTSYGSDKPDLRLGMKLKKVTEWVPSDLIGKISSIQDPIVEGLKLSISENPKETRKFVSGFLDSPDGKQFLDNSTGQPGIFIYDPSRPMSGLDAFGFEASERAAEEFALDQGDLLVLQVRQNEPHSGGSTPLGNLRLALHKAAVAQGLIDPPKGFEFVWITNFPLFSPSNDIDPGQGGAAGLSSTHHPFTAPKTAEDLELLLVEPEKATAAHYDIVVNGVELGGGSRRIHNADVQEFILRDVLKMSNERLEDFRHLIDVLRSGCPPHAGIALGWDRLIAVMMGKDSVRDVIAFPKSGKGEDLLVKSPNAITKEQLETYHLQLKQ